MAQKKLALGGAMGFIEMIVVTLMAAIRKHGEEAIFSLPEEKVRVLTKQFVGTLIEAGKPAVQEAVSVTKPTEPPYLVDTGSRLTLSVREELDVEGWVKSLPIYDQGSNFCALVKGRIERDVPAGQLRQFRNTRYGGGAAIVEEIKKTHGGTYSRFADIKTLIESGAAKKDGTWCTFMIEIDGAAWLVSFSWYGVLSRRGWSLNAHHPEDCHFNADRQFLFRDSN